ncbi:MAG TPA: VOC family protein [Rhizomicrobium sp.]
MSRPVHFEIHANDPKKALTFYGDLFGWTFSKFGPMEYWLIDTGEGAGINGGLVARRGASPAATSPVNAFVCSVGVDSVDAYVARAVKAGATVAVPKTAIPGVGYNAYIKDPDGNLLGLHERDTGAK